MPAPRHFTPAPAAGDRSLFKVAILVSLALHLLLLASASGLLPPIALPPLPHSTLQLTLLKTPPSAPPVRAEVGAGHPTPPRYPGQPPGGTDPGTQPAGNPARHPTTRTARRRCRRRQLGRLRGKLAPPRRKHRQPPLSGRSPRPRPVRQPGAGGGIARYRRVAGRARRPQFRQCLAG